MKAACTAIPDSKGLQTDSIKQWFSTLAALQKHLGSFQNAVAKASPQTSEVRIFWVDANAAARVENHCTNSPEFPFWSLRMVDQYSAAALGEKAIISNLSEHRGSLGAPMS